MNHADTSTPRATFTSIETSTAEDWQLIAREFGGFARQLPDRILHHLGMDRDMREAYRDSPHYTLTEEFCAKYDSPAFDPAAETLPLSHFEPMLRRVLAEPRNSIYRAALD